MECYKCLNDQVFSKNDYKIVPIRYQDRYVIMQWRNEQLYHLRQPEPLTKDKQDRYYDKVVSKLFNEQQPNQILFSFLKEDVCVGYGGLVHLNWIDKNAEISFVMNTRLETKNFHKYWSIYLGLIEKVGFEQLQLHKLFVYAFDLRPHLYEVLESENYINDARLKEHCFFENKFIDVVIHSKINKP